MQTGRDVDRIGLWQWVEILMMYESSKLIDDLTPLSSFSLLNVNVAVNIIIRSTSNVENKNGKYEGFSDSIRQGKPDLSPFAASSSFQSSPKFPNWNPSIPLPIRFPHGLSRNVHSLLHIGHMELLSPLSDSNPVLARPRSKDHSSRHPR